MKNRYRAIISVIIQLILFVSVLGKSSNQTTFTGSKYDTLFYGGLTRTFRIHIPKSYINSKSIPLVIALHGGGGSAEAMVALTRGGFDVLSEKEGFIVVYPEGIDKHWNDGRGLRRYKAQRENINDVGFISYLIDYLHQKYDIDRTRVYVTGMSNGAIMSFRLACELSGKIAAIAPVAGLMPENIFGKCNPSEPVSVLIINSTDDPITPWTGGYFKLGILRFGKGISVRKAALFWAEFNGCSGPPVIEVLPDKDPDDGTRVQRIWYGKGREGTEVVLYKISGSGHTWPGGYQYLRERIIGKACNDINACEIIWSFFKRHKSKL
ncbi:phospholipase [candidate division KSB1 bacterium]|nr:MAG: phospholipase [candidate division KSB1 bacterium]